MKLKDTEELSEKDIAAIHSVLSYIEKHSYLAETRLNPNTLISEPIPEHRLCLEYEDYIRDYLKIRGIELIRTSANATYYLAGEKVRVITPTKNIINFLCVVKLISNEKKEKLNTRDLYFTKKSFREKGAITGLFKEKITEAMWREGLSFMKTHSLITFQGSIDQLEDEDKIYIYPTISIYVHPNLISSIENVLPKEFDVKEYGGSEE